MKKTQTRFSHLDDAGRARMVNVSSKPEVARKATATGFVSMAKTTIKALRAQALPKGDVLTVAQIAGIQGAKMTSTLIPMCHPLPLHGVDITFRVKAGGVEITATTHTHGKTGVEMEALTAVTTAALSVYDMCKAVDKQMVIGSIQVIDKQKG